MTFFEQIDSARIPQKLEENNILNAFLIVRYKTEFPVEVVAWKLYETVQKNYLSPVATPLSQLPVVVRKSDPNLTNAILYNIVNKNDHRIALGVGEGFSCLSFSSFSYENWEGFKQSFLEALPAIQNGFVKNMFAIKYLNAFKRDISSDLEISLKIKEKEIKEENVPFNIAFQEADENYVCPINFLREAEFSYTDQENKLARDKGSVIDIEVQTRKINDVSEDAILEELHKKSEDIFFGIYPSLQRKN